MSVKRQVNDKAQAFLYYWQIFSGLDIMPVPEYKFAEQIKRKFQFDWAFPDQKVAIEIEGNAWNVPGGGKHMQDRDLEKYNYASEFGWSVFRFSPSMLQKDPEKCISHILIALGPISK